MTDAFQTIVVEPGEGYQVIRLNRPEALNALNTALMGELEAALDAAEADEAVRCVILTGSEKAFAAGADIREMAGLDYPQTYLSDFITRTHERAARFRKPLIAAVSGYALGGGCELAMMCDIVIAADTAKFGQPEVTLGIGPGIGGSQRLARAVGKAKAMDMVLTGRMMDAAEAERCGLVSRVVPAADLMTEAKGPMAVAWRNRKAFGDLSTLARIRVATKMSGFHKLYPIVKLANGDWYMADKAAGASTKDWVVEDIPLSDVRWYKLDIANVVTKGNPVDKIDLSKVDEIGFADIIPASGHGPGGWFDVGQIEVYGRMAK